MTPDAALVAAGGVVGAALRHEVGERVDRESVPLGTFAVNVLGSLVPGFVAGTGAGDRAFLLVGVGACGAFTTFSSFALDTVSLWVDEGRPLAAVLNAALTLGGALAAVGVGWWLAG